MLCAKCQALCSTIDPYQDNDFLHYETINELRTSANSACLLCKIIHEDLEKKLSKPMSLACRLVIKTRRDIGIEVSFQPTQGLQNDSKYPVVYVVFQSFNLPHRLTSTLQPLDALPDTNTGSDAAFRMPSAWLEECLETHKICSASIADDPPLPHRVIDVGSINGVAEPHLLETSGQVGNYLILSHCWGGGSPIMTTSKNIQSHLIQLKLIDLPRTFRDAIQVTRKLGCRYLWIDSLCIIQDNQKDWEVEAALMQQYYRQSLLTIAAADGNNSEAGLFRDRDRLSNLPCKLQFSDVHGSPRQLYAYTNSMSFELERSSLPESYKPNPLYRRAWVFQEQALSPRTLTYARYGISWRCQEMLFDERAPLMKRVDEFIVKNKTTNIINRGGDPRSTDATIAELQQKWIFPRPRPNPSRSFTNVGHHKKDCYMPEDEFLIDWGVMVRDYTERNLTYQSDKLIAIRGIADAVAPIVSMTYFAGIWVDSMRSILMGLLWTSQRRRSKQTPRLDIAPSWSWASTDGEVTWHGHMLCHLESRINIIELRRSGTAVNATAELVAEVNLRLGITEDGQVTSLIDWPEGPIESLSEQSIHAASSPKWSLGRLETPTSLDESLGNNVLVWFAELAAGKIHALKNRQSVHCLVLVRCGENPSAFRRVGYSIWEESKWASSELPEIRKRKLTIL